MILKIYNTEIVDCSSSFNVLIPNPISLKILIDVYLRLCESNAIESIIDHNLTLYFFQEPSIAFISPEGHTFGHYEWQSNKFRLHRIKYDLKLGDFARQNKINGLYIESTRQAQLNISNQSQKCQRRTHANKYYYNPSGLKGVRKSVEIVESLLSGIPKNLPIFLNSKELSNFEIRARVIWREWSKYKEVPGIGFVQCGEIDGIYGDSRNFELYLGSICLGGHNGRPNGDKHFADVQRVLNKHYPEYIIKEVGDSAADTNGRKVLYRDVKLNEIESIEPPNIYYGKRIDPKEKKLLIQIQKVTGKPFSFGRGLYLTGFISKNEHVVGMTFHKQKIEDLIKFLENFSHLKTLVLNECDSVKNLDLGNLKTLENLKIIRCNNLISFSPSLVELPNLKNVTINRCPKFESFPKDIEGLQLKELVINQSGALNSINLRDEDAINQFLIKLNK